MPTFGFDAKLYRNTGNYASPVWNEVTNIKDCKLNMTADEVNVTTRAGGGAKQTEPGLQDTSVEFGMVWDTADLDFGVIQAAYFARTSLELLILDGSKLVVGSQGLRVTMKVTKFERDESVSDALAVSVTMKNCLSAHNPAWYTSTT